MIKRTINFIGFFVIFFVLINGIYLLVIALTDWDFRKRSEMLHFDKPDFDVLVLGASTTLDGIDTELLTKHGFRAYNMAIGGATVRTSFVQLDEYLTKHSTKPKYVILGLNSTHEEFDIETIHPIIEVSMQGHKYSVNDIPILKFKWLGIEFLKKVISSKHRQARLSYGQLKFQKVISDDTRYKVNYLNTGKFTSSKWINEIAKLCCQNNIVLYILELPGYKELQNSSDVGPYNLVFNSECYTKLYNFNSKDFCEIFDPNKDWIGNSHLNEFGAKKFTETLLEYLVE